MSVIRFYTLIHRADAGAAYKKKVKRLARKSAEEAYD